MNKIKMGIMIAAAIFLCASWGYGQELSDWERGIFYNAAWQALQGEYQLSIASSEEEEQKVEAAMRQFLSQNSVTEDQLHDIIERGNQMPFTAAEEQLAQELDTKITEYTTADQIMTILNESANKYGMSIGQVSSVYTRRILRGDE